ncbi:hypothetical protein Ahy_B03g065457 isoform C [Arachis hypogaea]|uniref:RING-type domain-containing protein n=1 Tax=Arachis hypogaea TaxID=3818 RepID=A0A445A1N4_ARAHY|nr:hypothetical protein Ahy_B03g065457 isoform C [Arachis hypogaea]
MSDVLSPFTVSPPPPSSSTPSNKNGMPMLYYGLVVVGTAAIVLAIYNLIIIKRCNRRRNAPDQSPTTPRVRSFENNNYYAASQRNYLLSSFKYKKEKMTSATSKEGSFVFVDGGSDECPVCLSAFEEGEEVRKLPRCKHSFHALCIDMWLYSHFDCPICRTPVGLFSHPFPAENSRSGGGISA